MKDRKTICEALKLCSDETEYRCNECPYNIESSQCVTDLTRDALALISILEENEEN